MSATAALHSPRPLGTVDGGRTYYPSLLVFTLVLVGGVIVAWWLVQSQF